MSFEGMNWAAFALGVSAGLGVLILITLRLRPWGWAGLFAATGHYLIACLNAAAPIRGSVDPNYVGWAFGHLFADAPQDVALAAGGVFLSAALAALLSAGNGRGPIMWFTAMMSAYFLAIAGVPFVMSALKDMSQNTVQFGEYLTVPGEVATPILIAVLVLPLGFCMVWASWRALKA